MLLDFDFFFQKLDSIPYCSIGEIMRCFCIPNPCVVFILNLLLGST